MGAADDKAAEVQDGVGPPYSKEAGVLSRRKGRQSLCREEKWVMFRS